MNPTVNDSLETIARKKLTYAKAWLFSKCVTAKACFLSLSKSTLRYKYPSRILQTIYKNYWT